MNSNHAYVVIRQWSDLSGIVDVTVCDTVEGVRLLKRLDSAGAPGTRLGIFQVEEGSFSVRPAAECTDEF